MGGTHHSKLSLGFPTTTQHIWQLLLTARWQRAHVAFQGATAQDGLGAPVENLRCAVVAVPAFYLAKYAF